MEKSGLKILLRVVYAFIALILILSFWPLTIINSGERGIVLNWGETSGVVLNEGLNWKIPFKQEVIKVDVRTQKNEVNVLAYSKDIQTVTAVIALNYHLDPQNVNKLYQDVGLDFDNKIIQPAIEESVKAATAKFTAQELIEKRPEVKDEIKTFLKERLAGWNIIVDEFSIANFDFSDQYERAIEEKQVAQQEALKAENDLKRIQIEAEQRVAQAQAEAEAIKLQSQAADNDKYVELKRLEVQLEAVKKWNGVLPTQMIPDSSVPFVDVK